MKNYTKIMKILFVLLCILYLYTVVAYLNYRNDFNNSTKAPLNCNTNY